MITTALLSQLECRFIYLTCFHLAAIARYSPSPTLPGRHTSILWAKPLINRIRSDVIRSDSDQHHADSMHQRLVSQDDALDLQTHTAGSCAFAIVQIVLHYGKQYCTMANNNGAQSATAAHIHVCITRLRETSGPCREAPSTTQQGPLGRWRSS